MKNQAFSMFLAWAISVGLIPESATDTVMETVGAQGYEKPFEFAAVIILGFILQSLKPLLELLPRLSQSYADKVTAEFNLTDGLDDSKPKVAAKKTTTAKKISKPAGK